MKNILNLFTQKDKIKHILSGTLLCFLANWWGLWVEMGLNDLRPWELFLVAISTGAILAYGFEWNVQHRFSGENKKGWFWQLLDKWKIIPQKFKTTPDNWDIVATVIGFAIGILIFMQVFDYQNL